MLDQAHTLAGVTGSDVVLFLIRESPDRVQTYVTPKLSALTEEEGGRALILKCLYDAEKLKLPAGPSTTTKRAEEDALQREPRSFDGIIFERDEDKRLEELKKRFLELRQLFLAATLPSNPKGLEGLLIICTLAQQMLVASSPAFKPFLSAEGQNLLKTMLNSSAPNHVGAIYQPSQ